MTVEDIIKRNREKWSKTKEEIAGMTRTQIILADGESMVTLGRRLQDMELMIGAARRDIVEGDYISLGDDLRSILRTADGALDDFPRMAALRTAREDWARKGE